VLPVVGLRSGDRWVPPFIDCLLPPVGVDILPPLEGVDMLPPTEGVPALPLDGVPMLLLPLDGEDILLLPLDGVPILLLLPPLGDADIPDPPLEAPPLLILRPPPWLIRWAFNIAGLIKNTARPNSKTQALYDCNFLFIMLLLVFQRFRNHLHSPCIGRYYKIKKSIGQVRIDVPIRKNAFKLQFFFIS
jgi:hypothetical protein